MICENTDFQFPMQASIYYPIVEQNAYGNITKDWILDKIIACNFVPSGTKERENIKTLPNVTEELRLIGRVKTDIRISSEGQKVSPTNVIVSNIIDKNGNQIYTETAGPRSGKSTIFEISTIEPFVGAFGSVEYYNILLKRSENQAVTV
jgi:hypothetical protein